MKSLMISGLLVSILTGTSTQNVRAEKVVLNSATFNKNSSASSSELTPFALVKEASHGSFKAEGIPAYQPLINAYFGGDITSQQLVAAAVKANRLPPNYLNDSSYINAVDMELRRGLTVY